MQGELSTPVSFPPAAQDSDSLPRILTFTQYLSDRGYAASTARSYIRCVEHFECWLASDPLGIKAIDEAALVLFLRDHLPVCSCPSPSSLCNKQVRAAVHQYLTVLRKQELILPSRRPPPSDLEKEVLAFDKHLIETCGVAVETRTYRLRYVREFLETTYGSGPVNAHSLQPLQIMSFLIQRAKHCKSGTAKVIAASIRSYLKFLILRGILDRRMLAAVHTTPNWRLSSIPKVLSETELDQFLSLFDVSYPTGCRDYAMALCLIDLGLRTSEVALLCIDDINWRDGTLRILGTKGHRERILPLTSRVGGAIVDYLKEKRPKSAERALFLRHSVPAGTPVTRHIVRAVVRVACARIGILPPRSGPHTFRHTLASRMLQRGASLKEIADVLGHRTVDTTAIYTKVDLPSLSQVALPWPEVGS